MLEQIHSTTTLGGDAKHHRLVAHRPHLEQIARDLEHINCWVERAQERTGATRVGTVFGSARAARNSGSFTMAEHLGAELAKSGWVVLTGGGPGIMQAIRDGVGAERSRAVRIEIDGEHPETALDPSRSITVESFALRKLLLIQGVDAIWAFPGGVGTMDELFEVLVLQDTHRLRPIPITLVEPEGSTYWGSWLQFVKDALIASGMVSEQILTPVRLVTSINAAVTVETTVI